MSKKLVSIVSPCYNGERYIERYLKAILSQTYRPLELILVNDGSKDNTDEIINSYKEKIENDNIIFKYIVKENEGVGAAVNDGIKYITGDYIIWPDSDDILYPENIEKRVEYLEANPQYGWVSSDGEKVDEGNIEVITGELKANIPENGEMFIKVLTGDLLYNPMGYMLRTSAFLDVNPNKEIYPSRYGQNIQMLMPIAYKYRCGYLKEKLYAQVMSDNSLSKQVWNENDMAWKNRILGLSDIYTETLKQIGGEALAYIPYLKFKDLRSIAAVAKNRKRQDSGEYKKLMKKSRAWLIKEIIKSYLR